MKLTCCPTARGREVGLGLRGRPLTSCPCALSTSTLSMHHEVSGRQRYPCRCQSAPPVLTPAPARGDQVGPLSEGPGLSEPGPMQRSSLELSMNPSLSSCCLPQGLGRPGWHTFSVRAPGAGLWEKASWKGLCVRGKSAPNNSQIQA